MDQPDDPYWMATGNFWRKVHWPALGKSVQIRRVEPLGANRPDPTARTGSSEGDGGRGRRGCRELAPANTGVDDEEPQALDAVSTNANIPAPAAGPVETTAHRRGRSAAAKPSNSHPVVSR